MGKMIKYCLAVLLVLAGCKGKTNQSSKAESLLKVALKNTMEETIGMNEIIPFEYEIGFNLSVDLSNKEISEWIGMAYESDLPLDKDRHLIFIQEGEIVEDFYCSLDEGACLDLRQISQFNHTEAESFRLDRDEKGNYLLHEISYEELPPADFSHSVFLGNSKIEGLMNSGLISEADYICKVGWNVGTAFTETDIFDEDQLLIDKINSQAYNKIFLLFGDNELGWSYPEMFIADYKAIVEELKVRQPEASIYIMSIFPVSKRVSEQNKNGVTNENVCLFNNLLKTMCEEEGLYYLDVYSVLAEDEGALPEDSSPDGIHPDPELLKEVVEYMKEHAKL